MELTTALPCVTSSPATSVSQRDESIIVGTRAISGSEAVRLRNVRMAAGPSISPSSMQTSMTCAPASTCARATVSASS